MRRGGRPRSARSPAPCGLHCRTRRTGVKWRVGPPPQLRVSRFCHLSAMPSTSLCWGAGRVRSRLQRSLRAHAGPRSTALPRKVRGNILSRLRPTLRVRVGRGHCRAAAMPALIASATSCFGTSCTIHCPRVPCVVMPRNGRARLWHSWEMRLCSAKASHRAANCRGR